MLLDALRQEIQVLRRSLDLVLDENERLLFGQFDRRLAGMAKMSRATAQVLPQGEARQQERTKAQCAYPSQASRRAGGNVSGDVQTTDAAPNDIPGRTPRTISSIDDLSRVVVRWVFPASSEPRVRMVAAAIRNRLTSDK